MGTSSGVRVSERGEQSQVHNGFTLTIWQAIAIAQGTTTGENVSARNLSVLAVDSRVDWQRLSNCLHLPAFGS